MAIEFRNTDRVSKAKQASDNAPSQSLFRQTTHSAPLPNRRPVSGSVSKHTPTAEEIAAIPPFRGEEQPVGKSYSNLARHCETMAEDELLQKATDNPTIRRQARAHDGGTVTEYVTGLIHWQDPDSEFAGMGIEALMKGRES